MVQITYTNKESLNEIPSIPDINKVKAADMNEIKSVVNGNTTELLHTLGLDRDTYSQLSTYEVGAIVLHENKIWECTTAITIAETWNSAHWTLVPVFV